MRIIFTIHLFYNDRNSNVLIVNNRQKSIVTTGKSITDEYIKKILELMIEQKWWEKICQASTFII